jgi:hypothetical protein
MDDYFPLSKPALRAPFGLQPLGQIFPDSAPRSIAAGAGQVLFTQHPDSLHLSGKDRFGLPYSVQLESRPYYTLFRADLDHNGQVDLILSHETYGNGLAPTHHLISLLFEADGRPMPFSAEGYFEIKAQGIPDLIDLDRDGRAELIFMSYEQGYWITQLYKAQNARWQKVTGLFAQQRFPLYTRFSERPNRQAVQPPGKLQFGVPQLSNNHPTFVGQLTSYQWANVDQSEDILLNLKAENGKSQSCRPLSWYSTFTVMLDHESGRQIAVLSQQTAMQSLLDEAIKHKYAVKLFGERDSKVCRPELLWASDPRRPDV